MEESDRISKESVRSGESDSGVSGSRGECYE